MHCSHAAWQWLHSGICGRQTWLAGSAGLHEVLHWTSKVQGRLWVWGIRAEGECMLIANLLVGLIGHATWACPLDQLAVCMCVCRMNSLVAALNVAAV